MGLCGAQEFTFPGEDGLSIERWRVLGIVGGILGLSSLFMPWLAYTVVGVLNYSIGFSPVDFLRFAALPSGAVPASTNATSLGSPSLGTAALLIVSGGVIVGLGSFIAILYRLRGGIVMMMGVLLGLAGGLIAPFMTLAGLALVFTGPSWGIGVAFLGAIVVLAGLWIPERGAKSSEEEPSAEAAEEPQQETG